MATTYVTNTTRTIQEYVTDSETSNPKRVKEYPATIMTIDGGVGDFASDIQYSTKANTPVMAQTTVGFGGDAKSTRSMIMGVGGGVGDFAADVGYSTKPNAPIMAQTTQTTQTAVNYGSTVGDAGSTVMGVGGESEILPQM